ncbi:MAG: hypothetical protein JWM80_2010 [Cyanobacteria bacterium RYN_339]|nr:hypothetical protein [Cyanobacteria bacterium RYN_339]
MLVGKRAGSMVVSSFMFVIGIMVIFAGVATVLQNQMRQSVDVKAVSLAKIQAYYLAEMGINDIMNTVNQAPAAPVWPGNGTVVDFSSKVSMVRGTAGTAKCTYLLVSAGSPRRYQVQSSLTVAGDPTVYQRGITFGATYNGSLWTLADFTLIK